MNKVVDKENEKLQNEKGKKQGRKLGEEGEIIYTKDFTKGINDMPAYSKITMVLKVRC